MSKILLQSVFLNDSRIDVLIDGNRFAKIAKDIPAQECAGAEVVDCKDLAILPPFYNAHTHAAMVLLRGYADDLPLRPWLEDHIWPFEAVMGPDEIEIGSRLATLEMIKSGTVFFADMYWHRERTMKVATEMGLRAAIGVTMAENLMTPDKIEANFAFARNHVGENDRVKLVMMPHSIYLVGEALLKRCAEVARAEGMLLHTHLSETQSEVEQCIKEHGCSPVEWLKRCGLLNESLVAAHCVHLSDADMALMAESGATAVLNPCSNLKLNSGIPDIPAMLAAKMKVALGTDGASSNNNLDMREEMKFAALLAKVKGTADTLPAGDALHMATRASALAYGIDAGVIAEGTLADALLVRLDDVCMSPLFNLTSNWVYAANSGLIDSVICDGKFLMRNRHVDGDREIIAEAEKCAKTLASKVVALKSKV
ncbi:amidohydrolase [uncultured Fibrobacter sp.]|uniref:amidohydrolase n=1 Tax=uncultured Fibrobacter sp. TaxID=261512 RepID=UPI0025DB9F6D|nr:amidohydrolase [uncultured Fibrobacter sp.]